MKVKGFTLIELLAVIVILAIIALIATPIILNIIENTKNSSVLRSGELYIDAVEQAIARKNFNSGFDPISCKIKSDGNLTCGDDTLIVESNGSRPTDGIIVLKNGKITNVIDMILDKYILKTDIENNITIGKTDYLMINTSGNEDEEFLGGTIKRNQVESITMLKTKTVPSDALGSFDVSEKQNRSIMAWYKDSDNNGLYELYIGEDGGVIANPDSSNLFIRFTNLKKVDLSNFITSKVNNMRVMFHSCTSLTELNLENFDTSNVTNMDAMFYNCTSLSNLNISSFNTSKVKIMNAMFSNCNSLEHLDVSSFNTSKVTIMKDMFSNLSNLIELNLKNFDTSSVTSVAGMFYGSSKIEKLDLGNFDTEKVNESFWMFKNCSNLKTINFEKASFDNIMSYNSMFEGNSNLISIVVKDVSAKTFIESRLADVSKTGVRVSILSNN